MVLFIISPLCLRVAGSVGPEIELLIGERRGSVCGLALELPRVGQVRAPCPSSGLSGKIGAMDRACERPALLRAWPSGLLCVLLLLELGACGSHVPTTCGMGGVQPPPISAAKSSTCATRRAASMAACFCLTPPTGRCAGRP